MKYSGIPWGMWVLFGSSFQKNLTKVLGMEPKAARQITARSKTKYKEIIASLPEFESGDPFQINLVSCAMFCAFLLNMDPKPSLEKLTEYYKTSMMTTLMNWYCRYDNRTKFSYRNLKSMKNTADLKAALRNPYSWNMEFYQYPDGSGYEARFIRCGILTLMTELGLGQYTPAMCCLDHAMAKPGGTVHFVRKHTLAGGGPYCDCGYHKKGGRIYGRSE